MVLCGQPHHGGEQAQRVGAATVGQGSGLDLAGQGFRLAGDGLRGALHGLAGQKQLQLVGKRIPRGQLTWGHGENPVPAILA